MAYIVFIRRFFNVEHNFLFILQFFFRLLHWLNLSYTKQSLNFNLNFCQIILTSIAIQFLFEKIPYQDLTLIAL